MTSDLAARIEAAEAGEQLELLEEAYLALFGKSPIWHEQYGDGDDRKKGHAFQRMINAGAYESAALMLVPEGWGGSIHFSENRLHSTVKLGRSYPTNANAYGEATTPALALAAAALRAKENDRG